MVTRSIDEAVLWLFHFKEGVNVSNIEWQAERAIVGIDLGTLESSEITRISAGPWVCVDFHDGTSYAIWKVTGDVYGIDSYGAVEDEPLEERAEPA